MDRTPDLAATEGGVDRTPDTTTTDVAADKAPDTTTADAGVDKAPDSMIDAPADVPARRDVAADKTPDTTVDLPPDTTPDITPDTTPDTTADSPLSRSTAAPAYEDRTAVGCRPHDHLGPDDRHRRRTLHKGQGRPVGVLGGPVLDPSADPLRRRHAEPVPDLGRRDARTVTFTTAGHVRLQVHRARHDDWAPCRSSPSPRTFRQFARAPAGGPAPTLLPFGMAFGFTAGRRDPGSRARRGRCSPPGVDRDARLHAGGHAGDGHRADARRLRGAGRAGGAAGQHLPPDAAARARAVPAGRRHPRASWAGRGRC